MTGRNPYLEARELWDRVAHLDRIRRKAGHYWWADWHAQHRAEREQLEADIRELEAQMAAEHDTADGGQEP